MFEKITDPFGILFIDFLVSVGMNQVKFDRIYQDVKDKDSVFARQLHAGFITIMKPLFQTKQIQYTGVQTFSGCTKSFEYIPMVVTTVYLYTSMSQLK